MILAIDIGNTNIVLGCCRGEEVLFRERVSTVHTSTVLEYAAMLKTAFEMNGIAPESIHGAIISSVVPAVTTTISALMFIRITLQMLKRQDLKQKI